MGVLALVDVDPEIARNLESLGDVRRCVPGADMQRVLKLVQDRLDVVVVGHLVGEPVQVVQRAHRIARDAAVVLLLDQADQCARVARALSTAPFVGLDVTCVDLSTADVFDAVGHAAERTRARRSRHAMYADLNARLAASSERHPPSAEVTAAALLDFAPIGIVALDSSQRIVSANREASRLLGAREIDLLGREIVTLPFDAKPDWLDRVKLPHEEPPIVEVRDEHGCRHILEIRGAPIAEQPGHTFLALTDVTPRVRAETAREAARHDAENARRALETTLRSIGDAVITTDRAGCVTMMNPIAEALTGWREGDGRGRHLDEVFRILNEGTREPVESPVAKVLRQGVIVGLANHTVLVRRDGREHPIDDSAAPIRDFGGDVHGVVLVFRSVSAEKRRELRRSLIVDVTSALSATLDYREALGSLAAIFVPRIADWCAVELMDEGDGPPELVAIAHRDEAKAQLGREVRAMHSPAADDPFSVTTVLRTGQSVFLPDVTRSRLSELGVHGDRIRDIEMLGIRSVVIVPLVGRDGVLGAITFAHAESSREYSEEDRVFLEDVARRVGAGLDNARLFAAEQRARAEADAANRAKDEFLATVSHELRTPLNAILGWARMIATGKLTTERERNALETIERNAIAMAQLIDDLLDVSRIISGRLRLEPEWVDPIRVIEAALDAVRPAAAAKELDLRTVFDTGTATVLADPNRLQQMVWNLLSNAVKFTPRGGRVDVILRRVDSNIELTVTDTGKGIPRSFLRHVFDPFRQADGTSTRVHGGLGLGLAITRHLVELHGGKIEARSEGEGRGATFTVALPISAVRPERSLRELRGAANMAPPVPLVDLAGIAVLAVDDDADARALIKDSLEFAGARVVTAASVAEAMESFARAPPDVLVSDVGMPTDDGYVLIRKVRALPADKGGIVPAAALTAYARTEDRKKLLAAGFTLHLAKPIDPSELVNVVATLSRFSRRI